MKTHTETHRVVDVPVAPSSTLRVAMVTDGDAGKALVLSHGFGGGAEPFRRPNWCGPPIRLPVEVLPALRRALDVLADE